jgi:hypothetical protein
MTLQVVITLDGDAAGWIWLVSGAFFAGGGVEPTAQRAATRALQVVADEVESMNSQGCHHRPVKVRICGSAGR